MIFGIQSFRVENWGTVTRGTGEKRTLPSRLVLVEASLDHLYCYRVFFLQLLFYSSQQRGFFDASDVLREFFDGARWNEMSSNERTTALKERAMGLDMYCTP